MCAPCVATPFPVVELPVQGLHQVGARPTYRGIERRDSPHTRTYTRTVPGSAALESMAAHRWRSDRHPHPPRRRRAGIGETRSLAWVGTQWDLLTAECGRHCATDTVTPAAPHWPFWNPTGRLPCPVWCPIARKRTCRCFQ